ncbi:MAG: hypothetical protein J6B25_08900 [Clostridia bacterium]|nr:hypothetical protein [Clostridia bacterium]
MAVTSNKKRIIIAAVCIAVALAVAIPLLVRHLTGSDITLLSDAGITDAEQVTLISHRGMNVYAPENTLEAADKAAEFGYTHVEFDIRQTKDGVWVLMHDEDIKRTTNGKGKISDLKHKQLFDYRINVNAKTKDNIVIPTLDEMIIRCNGLGLHPVIEIKQDGTEFIESLIRSTGHLTYSCTIISFSREQVEAIHTILSSGNYVLTNSNTDLYWLVSDLSDETLTKAKGNTNIGVSFNGNKAGTAEEIKKFTDSEIELATWTIDEPERLAELYALGIRTFTTNSITPYGFFANEISSK